MMGPVQAITTCLRKSATFSGRASRSEFWWFAPLGLAPPALSAIHFDWLKLDFYGIWRVMVLIMLSLPLLSAGARRLQDTDEEGSQIMWPFAPCILLWIGYQMVFWLSVGSFYTGWGIVGLVLGFVALLILVPAYLFALFVSFMTIGPIIGLLLVPSQPGPNRYGPNPHEVPQ